MDDNYGVIVIGGGLAGVSAALSAARLGCQVALVQDRPVLGGNSSSEMKVSIQSTSAFNPWARETGILEELFLEDRKRNHGSAALHHITSIWDLVLYEKIKQEKKLHLFLNTSARKASTSTQKGSKRIEEIECVQLGNEKVFRLRGKIFIDASGDGAIAHSAGAEFRMGREAREEFGESLAPEKPDEGTQGSSLGFHARDMGHSVPFEAPPWAIEYSSDNDLPFRPHESIGAGYFWLDIGTPFNTISDNEKIRDELLKHLLGVWDHIKNHGEHGAKNYALDWIGMVPGKRESRRFVGDYILTEKDVKAATLFPDRVAYGGAIIGIHTPGGILAKSEPPDPTYPHDLKTIDQRLLSIYSIPFRCLYSRNVENLMMAGRDISVSHVALGTTRYMGPCAIIGQAAGTGAYLCLKHKTNPRGVYQDHIDELQQLLLNQDCYIPMMENHDPKDLTRGARVTASSAAVLEFEDREREDKIYVWPMFRPLEKEKGEELTALRAQLFPVSSDHIRSISLLLESRRSEDTEVRIGLRQAKTVWDFDSEEDVVTGKASVSANSVSWVTFSLNHPLVGNSLYWVYVAPKEKIFWRYVDSSPVGAVAACKLINRWYYRKGSHLIKIDPPSRPYQPENVLSGTTRPERWTNLWVSDPRQAFPQSLELDFDEEKTFNAIYLVFNTDLNRVHMSTPPLWRAPGCVRDYSLYCWEKGAWKTITQVQGNYQRCQVHRFPSVASQKLRLQINSTNGVPSAHVFGVRVYNE